MHDPLPHGCPCCGRPGLAPSLAGLLACPACGHMLWPHTPQAGDLAGLYGRDYFHGAEYGDYDLEEAAIKASLRPRLRRLLRALGPEQRNFLLEIGCAYGYFLSLAINHFNFVLGLDLSRAAVERCRAQGLPALAGGIEDLAPAAGDPGANLPSAWDAICLWDTIEHLPHPEQAVARAAELLAPGGVLALTTGDAGSLLARLRGPRWRQIHPPTHLHYFTRPSLLTLLAGQGLEVVHLGRPGMWRSLGGITHHLLAGRPGGARLHGLVLRSGLGKLPIYANTLDYMFVLARKPKLLRFEDKKCTIK